MRFSSGCWETVTLILDSCWSAPGAWIMLMDCFSSFSASLSSFSFFPFHLSNFPTLVNGMVKKYCQRNTLLWHIHFCSSNRCKPQKYSNEKEEEPSLNVNLRPTISDFVYRLNDLKGPRGEVPVISFRPITLPLKLKG